MADGHGDDERASGAQGGVSASLPSDMFIGDDFHHNGAFRLMYAFSWLAGNARTRTGQGTARGNAFDWDARWVPLLHGSGCAGAPRTALLSGSGACVERLHAAPELRRVLEIAERPEGSRNRPADLPILNVAGWFDAEDFYGR